MKKSGKRKSHNSFKQPTGFSNGFIPVEHFSLKTFFIQILIGLIGILGILYFTPAFEAVSAGENFEPFKFGAFLFSVALVMASLFGIYDWLCTLLDF